ncbi:MAG: DUF6273 domain-containing protein [Saccharofermentans sp.]|nr:DUF6273 domain-containing protein [Saccharofermentans sp.]
MNLRKAFVSMAAILMAGLLPFSAFQKSLRAESGKNDKSDKAIRSGTEHIPGAMESNVYFGNYWQSVKSEDATDSNKEPVKWRVLANDGNLFVVSDQNLDCVEYNSSAETVTWEECSLRKWLNSKFIDKAFTMQEQGAVLESLVVNEDGAKGSEAGANTYDKVYLLSIYEVIDPDLGFPTDWKDKGGTRVALNTEYTKSKRAITGSDMSGAWWLRTPGDANNAANVFNAGNVFVRGGNVNNFIFAVRPAMNIDTSKVLFTSPAEGGKTSGVPGADAMKEVGSYTGSDWKLTIKDDARPVFEASVSGSKTILKDGAVNLKYEGAKAGANEYISVMIEDTEGTILYYGNIIDNTSADAADSGKATLNVPADLTPGNYTIKVFSEQCNGDFKTDLASNIVTLDITISKYTTADRNLCIGTGAAIVAAACIAVFIAVRKKKHA